MTTLGRIDTGVSGKQRCFLVISLVCEFEIRRWSIRSEIRFCLRLVLLHLFLTLGCSFLIVVVVITVHNVRRDEVMHSSGDDLYANHTGEKESDEEI